MFLHVSVILFTGISGISVHGGISVRGRGVLSGGEVSVMETPPYGNERAVRILLERILILFNAVVCFQGG